MAHLPSFKSTVGSITHLRIPTHSHAFPYNIAYHLPGNFGATAAIAEMLLQSQRVPDLGLILLLPALPGPKASGAVSAWDIGAFEGLRARGGYTISMRWGGSKVKALTITRKSAVDFGGSPLPLLLRMPASFVVPNSVSASTSGSSVPLTCVDRPQGLDIRFDVGCLKNQVEYEIHLKY
jgi:hypothetical protein